MYIYLNIKLWYNAKGCLIFETKIRDAANALCVTRQSHRGAMPERR